MCAFKVIIVDDFLASRKWLWYVHFKFDDLDLIKEKKLIVK
jgi:hypothetical protein